MKTVIQPDKSWETASYKTDTSITTPVSLHHIPENIIRLLRMSLAPHQLCRMRTVFMGGRVYAHEYHGESAREDTWRTKLGHYVRKAGFTPLTGIHMDLHGMDTRAGAGRSYFHIQISPLHLVEGTGRIGVATVQEVDYAKSQGHKIGVILNPEEYTKALTWMKKGTSDYPAALPAYFSFDLTPESLICGYEGVGEWLESQSNNLSPRDFIGRLNPNHILDMVLRFAQEFAYLCPEDMEVYSKIIKDFPDKDNAC